MIKSPDQQPHVEHRLSDERAETSLERFRVLARAGYQASMSIHHGARKIELESDGRYNLEGDALDFDGRVVAAAKHIDYRSNPAPQQIDTKV